MKQAFDGGRKLVADDLAVFISYAGIDDEVPVGMPPEKGFVTFLRQQLAFQLKQIGPPRVKIWYDKARIQGGEQFDGKISQGLLEADLLIVVLSPNWMSRDWCRTELQQFAARWEGKSLAELRGRIVVVGKRHIPPDARPEFLQEQRGYLFYSLNQDDEVSKERQFYEFGEVQGKEYYETLSQLADYVLQRAKEVHKTADLTKTPACAEGAPAPVEAVKPVEPASTRIYVPNGRRVFLSKPADDMRPAYERIVKELEGHGYGVEPDPNIEMPRDSGALDFIETALAKSEASIHLLGEKPGFAPDDATLDRIVRLQLSCAAKRADAAVANGSLPFHRIIWAPKSLDERRETLDPTLDSRGRDPFAVLEQFDRKLQSDKVDGAVLSNFVIFLIQHLNSIVPPVPPWHGGDHEAFKRVYLYHTENDTDFAFQIADALRTSPVELIFPAFDGDEAGKRRLHQQNLDNCDVVAVCWAHANEVWAKGAADELKDWQGLGRKQPFSRRAVVAGPPPNNRKSAKALSYIFPRTQIDLVVNLVDRSEPTFDDLRALAPDAADSLRA